MTDPLMAGLEAINASPASDDRSLLVQAKCRGLLRGYHARWLDGPYAVDSVEETITSDLCNPETSRKSRSFTLAGKLDLKAHCDGRSVIIDHKTASDDIQDPAAPYWRQLVIEAQPSHYAMLEWLNGRKVDDVVWDVIHKPAIRPAAVTKKDQADTFSSGHYFGMTLSKESLEQLRATGREDLEMYEARLAHDCTVLRPQWYFQRRSVPRMDNEILEWATELWGHSQDLLIARRENRWPRNPGACMNYGHPCVYLAVCSGYDTPESDHWVKKAQVHNELPIVDSDGRDVLTNSRIRCFQTCRRRHYYQYELGIERQDEEEAEALFFGQVFHEALAVWFLALKDAQSPKE